MVTFLGAIKEGMKIYIYSRDSRLRRRCPRPSRVPPSAPLMDFFCAPILTQIVLKLPLCHDGFEYVLSFQIEQHKEGFYSARTDTQTHRTTQQNIDIRIRNIWMRIVLLDIICFGYFTSIQSERNLYMIFMLK